MTNEQIFELAEKHGQWDDFGRWTFRDDDHLLDFVAEIQNAEREKIANQVKSVLDGTSLDLWSDIREAGCR